MARKTLRHKSGDLLISIRLKCNPRRTFWRKSRVQRCPQRRVLGHLEKPPKSGIFWNSSKGGPRENRSKSRQRTAARKTLRRKSSDLSIRIRLNCNHRRTFWRKPRLQRCPQSRVLAKFRKDTKIGNFLKFFKGGTKGKSFKKWAENAGSKKAAAHIERSLNQYTLTVQSSENILMQTAGPKVPQKPSSRKFSKDTKIGHFLKIFKGGTKGKSFKKWGELGSSKNTPAQIGRSPN